MNTGYLAIALALSCAPRAWANTSYRVLLLPTRPQPVLSVAVSRFNASTDAPKPQSTVLAQGKIKAIAKPPKPGSVPYKDAVIAIHLVDVKALDGKPVEKEILVFAWGMRDKKWTAAADYQPGQTITLALQPWDEVAAQYGGYNRIELEGEDIFLLEPYWGTTPDAKVAKSR